MDTFEEKQFGCRHNFVASGKLFQCTNTGCQLKIGAVEFSWYMAGLEQANSDECADAPVDAFAAARAANSGG